MKKVKFKLSIGFAGADQEDIREYPDDVDEDDLDTDFEEWKNGYIEAYWEEVEA